MASTHFKYVHCDLITFVLFEQVWQAWQTVAPQARQLYLYSDTDALIPPSEVRRFMALQACAATLPDLCFWSSVDVYVLFLVCTKSCRSLLHLPILQVVQSCALLPLSRQDWPVLSGKIRCLANGCCLSASPLCQHLVHAPAHVPSVC